MIFIVYSNSESIEELLATYDENSIKILETLNHNHKYKGSFHVTSTEN
jgi:hypothetical protein